MREVIGYLVVASESQGDYDRCFVEETNPKVAVELGLKALGIRHAAWFEAIAVHEKVMSDA
jgi:hypothetical protein